MINSFKFYINLFWLLFKNNFGKLFGNLYLIFKNVKMVICFIIFLPCVYFLIKIQIYVGFILLLYYFIIFFVFYFLLRTHYVLSCEEIPLNTSNIVQYTFLNLIFFVPKSKVFLIFYGVLEWFFNNNKLVKKYKISLLLLVSCLIIYLLKFWIFVIIGYSYLSIVITSEFIINLFDTLNWNYENNKAKFQHILLNCFLNNRVSIGKANELKIIIKDDTIIFNIKNLIEKFLSKTKKSHLLKKAFNIDQHNLDFDVKKNYIDGHFNFLIMSDKYKDKNVSKNLTSTKYINVQNGDKSILLECKEGYRPNVKGEDKINFFTPTYHLDRDNAKIQLLKPNYIISLQKLTNNFCNSIINDKDEQILISENGVFFKNSDGMTVKQYCQEYKIPILENIKYFEEFEELNKDFLEIEENKKEFEVIKMLINGSINFNNEN